MDVSVDELGERSREEHIRCHMEELWISSPRLSWSSGVREEEEAKRVHQNMGSRVWIGVKVVDMLSGREERVERMREAESLGSFP